LKEFPQLTEKRGNYRHVMEVSKTHEEIRKVMLDVKENGAIPILLLLLLLFNKECSEK